jgi:hypothetical protein
MSAMITDDLLSLTEPDSCNPWLLLQPRTFNKTGVNLYSANPDASRRAVGIARQSWSGNCPNSAGRVSLLFGMRSVVRGANRNGFDRQERFFFDALRRIRIEGFRLFEIVSKGRF